MTCWCGALVTKREIGTSTGTAAPVVVVTCIEGHVTRL
jgi:hypothetical protein